MKIFSTKILLVVSLMTGNISSMEIEKNEINTDTINITNSNNFDEINLDSVITNEAFKADFKKDEKQACRNLASLILNSRFDISTFSKESIFLEKDSVGKRMSICIPLYPGANYDNKDFLFILKEVLQEYKKCTECKKCKKHKEYLDQIYNALDALYRNRYCVHYEVENYLINIFRNMAKRVGCVYAYESIYNYPEEAKRLFLVRENNVFDMYNDMVNCIEFVIRGYLDLIKLKDNLKEIIKNKNFRKHINKQVNKTIRESSYSYRCCFHDIIYVSRVKCFDLYYINSMYKLIKMASEWLKKYTFDAQKKYVSNQTITNYEKTRIIEDLTNKDRLKLYYEYIKKFLNHNTDKIKNFKTKAFNTIKINDLNLEGLHNYLNNNLDNFRKQYEFLRKNNLYTQEKTKEFLKIKRKNK